ncbi:hypothetical protein SEA_PAULODIABOLI_374 [Microbacterium phage PauloDiaboli]|nr:hypothetical protein SEA_PAULODIABOLI_19 [Microbacterium phage PauloDiaboli]QIG58057.1 hypothetical protein SEA_PAULODIABOLI_374 [Microbacterium phage PauloDiaboli]QWY83869.1 hypothetical protein SEA_A3WALLY_19 [Microbacterium phage A3Wally]QWY84179.1 hypothetical protein SEA_A3WALLY_372 [Microbacterium phage A3Wally]
MVLISFFFLLGAGITVAYWVGRGVRLNREQREIAAHAEQLDVRGLRPDDVVNVVTGEVLSDKERRAALRAGKVRFEI